MMGAHTSVRAVHKKKGCYQPGSGFNSTTPPPHSELVEKEGHGT